MDPHLRHLLRQMLEKRAADRIKLDAIFDHAWVTEEGASPLYRTNYVRIERAPAAGQRTTPDRTSSSRPSPCPSESTITDGSITHKHRDELRRLPSTRSSCTLGHADVQSAEAESADCYPALEARAQRSMSEAGSVPTFQGAPRENRDQDTPHNPPKFTTSASEAVGQRRLKSSPSWHSRGSRHDGIRIRRRLLRWSSRGGNSVQSKGSGISSRGGRRSRRDDSADTIKQAHIQQLRRRQFGLLQGHTGLSAQDEDLLLEHERMAIHSTRAQVSIEEIYVSNSHSPPRKLSADATWSGSPQPSRAPGHNSRSPDAAGPRIVTALRPEPSVPTASPMSDCLTSPVHPRLTSVGEPATPRSDSLSVDSHASPASTRSIAGLLQGLAVGIQQDHQRGLDAVWASVSKPEAFTARSADVGKAAERAAQTQREQDILHAALFGTISRHETDGFAGRSTYHRAGEILPRITHSAAQAHRWLKRTSSHGDEDLTSLIRKFSWSVQVT